MRQMNGVRFACILQSAALSIDVEGYLSILTDLIFFLNIFTLTAAFPSKSSHKKYFPCLLKSVSFCTLTSPLRASLVKRLCNNYFCCYNTVIGETRCSSHTDSPQKVTVHIRGHFQDCFPSVKSHRALCIKSCNFVS